MITKHYTRACKRCGELKVGYSERGYTHSLQYGYSRPEYCEICHEAEVKMRNDMAVPYLRVKPYASTESRFGMEEQHDSTHHAQLGRGKFDAARYGITTKNIENLVSWFVNPKHRVVVVSGPTGSGKSTALPFWLINPPEEIGIPFDFFTRNGQIFHTQPRILAVTGQSEYVGKELMGGLVGKGYDVGYTYSKDHNSDWRNTWISATDGTIINDIIKIKLENFGLMIIDEAHERSVNIDQILRIVRERMQLYPQLTILVSSATIDERFFCNFFGSDIAVVEKLEGKDRVGKDGKPVGYGKPKFRDIVNALPYGNMRKLMEKVVYESVNEAIRLVREIKSGRKQGVTQGDILVFLPGVDSITEAVDKTQHLIKQDEDLADLVKVYPLHGDLDPQDKERVKTHDLEDRKIWIIYSTNIAEASITIDSLGFEIETGLEVQPVFDPRTGYTRYPLKLISRSNAIQRWGRVGRTRDGEVYCLYTEEQYLNDNLFREHPVSAIQRSSIEEALLTLKVAGIPDTAEGWLENPNLEEVQRAEKELRKSKAISDEGKLGWRGAMLRKFSYSTKQVDALLLADKKGCLAEMASFLPYLEVGLKNLFDWKFSWDAYTKYEAYCRQSAFKAVCQNDNELMLKLVLSWMELPWLTGDEVASLTPEKIEDVRRQWTDKNFINYNKMEENAQIEAKTLTAFFENMTDKRRGIDLTQLSRIPAILAQSFTENQDSWMDRKKQDNKSAKQLFLRLFVDQIHPLGSRFLASKEGGTIIPNTATSLDTTPLSTRCINDDTGANGQHLYEVVGYHAEPLSLIVRTVPFPEPFEAFREMYHPKDIVEVVLARVLEYPGDYQPALLVQEMRTKLEILVLATDLAFSDSPAVITGIPEGAVLTMRVKRIDKDAKRVYLSNLGRTEGLLSKQFGLLREKKNVIARVVGIRKDAVDFLLEWADPSIGFMPVASGFGDALPKKSAEYRVGEEVIVTVSRNSKVVKTSLAELPEFVRDLLKAKKLPTGFAYQTRSLKYKEWMNSGIKYRLQSIADDEQYKEAVEKLYWLSNRLSVSRIKLPENTRE